MIHRIDSASPVAGPLFELFNHERYLSVIPRTRNVLDRIMAGIDTRELSSVVLFGSQAKEVATLKSDIDLCFVWRGDSWDEGFQTKVRDLAFPFVLIEPHCYSEADFTNVPDLVTLDSILFGISLHGHRYLFERRSGLQSIRKEVLLARLEGCRENLERATEVIGEAKSYFEGIVEVGLAEIEAVLSHGVTVSRAEVRPRKRFRKRIDRLEKALAEEGKLIWMS
jgi:predicted nucleotidyltransferase